MLDFNLIGRSEKAKCRLAREGRGGGWWIIKLMASGRKRVAPDRRHVGKFFHGPAGPIYARPSPKKEPAALGYSDHGRGFSLAIERIFYDCRSRPPISTTTTYFGCAMRGRSSESKDFSPAANQRSVSISLISLRVEIISRRSRVSWREFSR